METTMAAPLPGRSRAQEICSRLMMKPWIVKSDFKELVVDEDLRREVETRLKAVGLQLVDNFYSKYFAVRLADEIERDASLSWATNFGLEKPAVALLVVLWAKLVFPKRVAQERREQPGNVRALFPAAEPVPDVQLSTSESTLRAELGRKCGGAKLQVYLGQLRRLGFIEYSRFDHIVEGPLLDLLVDGQAMAIKLKNSALWDVLGRRGPAPYEGSEESAPEGQGAATPAPDSPPDPSVLAPADPLNPAEFMGVVGGETEAAAEAPEAAGDSATAASPVSDAAVAADAPAVAVVEPAKEDA